MKDSLGNVIYIGKAVNLKRRVGQYFMNSYKTRASNPKIASLVDCIADFEFFNTLFSQYDSKQRQVYEQKKNHSALRNSVIEFCSDAV